MKTFLRTVTLISAALVSSVTAEAPASYTTCAACHQADGNGIQNAFPPLAGSEWVNGPAENLIRIQLRGLQGKITVKGAEYNGVMPPNSSLSDEQIAEVLTYIRSNFGNKASAITAEQVKALRGEVGKPMLTVDDLIKPGEEKAQEAAPETAPAATEQAPTEQASVEAPAPPATPTTAEAPESKEVTEMEYKSDSCLGLPVYGWFILCLLPVLFQLFRKK